MFIHKERKVEIQCYNSACENYNKKVSIGISQIEEEEIKNILRCPKCGKEVIINKIKIK